MTVITIPTPLKCSTIRAAKRWCGSAVMACLIIGMAIIVAALNILTVYMIAETATSGIWWVTAVFIAVAGMVVYIDYLMVEITLDYFNIEIKLGCVK